MANRDGQPSRPYPPRASSRFAPGIYFNFEWGVSLAPERPAHVRGVNFTSRRMQERFHRDEQDRIRQNTQALPQTSILPLQPVGYDDQEIDSQTRDFQQERQRRLGVRPLEQHQRGSSAPPSFDRDDAVSPLSPEPAIRPVQQTASFPRERLDRPLPYSPARFRLGEDELPWSVPPWYRPPEPEFASPILPRTPPTQRSPRRSSPTQASANSKTSIVGPLPSLGFENTGRREKGSPRRREAARVEDPQRVLDLGELHSAMIGVEGLHNDGWESWGWEGDVEDRPLGPRSLGWAVRTEPELSHGSDFVGFYGVGSAGDMNSEILMSPPPGYLDSQWEEMGRRIGRPRTSCS